MAYPTFFWEGAIQGTEHMVGHVGDEEGSEILSGVVVEEDGIHRGARVGLVNVRQRRRLTVHDQVSRTWNREVIQW